VFSGTHNNIFLYETHNNLIKFMGTFVYSVALLEYVYFHNRIILMKRASKVKCSISCPELSWSAAYTSIPQLVLTGSEHFIIHSEY
jgi:hypothetical protein